MSRDLNNPGGGSGRGGGMFRRGALQVALGLTALVVFFWRIDVGAVLEQFTLIDPRWALLGLLVFTSSKVLHAWRWWAFLGRREVPLMPLAGIFLLSNMANSLLPLRAGDLLRVEVPNRRYGVPRSTLVSSVFVVESVLDLFAFAILLVTALLLSDLPVAMRPLVGLVGGSAVALMGVLVIMSRSQEAVVPVAARILGWLPDRVWSRIEVALPPFVDGMSSLKTNREAARVVVVSLVAWLAEVVVYWILARSFGLDLSVQQALILMIAANLVVSLPLTPWSVGPYELIVSETLVVLGADRNEGAAFALGSHLMLQAWIALTGVLAMWALQLRPRDLLPGRHSDTDVTVEAISEGGAETRDQSVG